MANRSTFTIILPPRPRPPFRVPTIQTRSLDFKPTHNTKDGEIDVHGDPCQTNIMQFGYRKRFLLVISWGLFSAWLFFGSLALAEQVNPTLDTSDQDEQALSHLAAGLKTDVPDSEDPSNDFPSTEIDAPFVFVPPHQVASGLVRAYPALRLYQRISVYRI